MAGLLVALGVIPHSGASAGAAAVFPMDVFFDVKQVLAQSSSWPRLVIVLVVLVLLRGAVLASTIALSDEGPKRPQDLFVPCGVLVGAGVVSLAPAAIVMFAGVASRYAPFVWLAALLGILPALFLTRRAVRLTDGSGSGESRGIPEIPAFIGYVFLVALLGAAMSSFGDVTRFVSAVIVILTAPIHGLVFIGWREHSRRGTYPAGGSVFVAITAIVLAILLFGTVFDRYIRDLPPVATTPVPGTLLLLGGVDSTLTTGALTDAEIRHFGFPESRTKMVSYRGVGESMTRSDTRADLLLAARSLADHVEDAETPVSLLGHSQAALILDRVHDRGLEAPDRSAVLAPPPPFPPSLAIPPPGETGTGKPGGDLTRAFAALVRSLGAETYDIDTPAFPTNLDPVAVLDSRAPRLAVWPLADSVWLDRDWRRPGETNVVALTDHVGVVNNARAIAQTRRFFAGDVPEDDEASWRGAVVSFLRHAFAPWRPEV